MTLTVAQVNKMTIAITLGRTWEERGPELPDTLEVRATWDRVAIQIAEIKAKGGIVGMLNDID